MDPNLPKQNIEVEPLPQEPQSKRSTFNIISWIIISIFAPITVLIFISQNTIPGDFFYPVKRGLENVVLAGASISPTTSAFFHTDLADRRFGEAEKLLVASADTRGLTDFIDEVQATQFAIDALSESSQKEELTQKLITKIDDYQAKLTQVQNQVQNTQLATSGIPTPVSFETLPTSESISSQNQPTQAAGPTSSGLQTSQKTCVQVIAYAKNPTTGQCQAFSTPCDVPSGWANCTTTQGGQTVPQPTTRVVVPTTQVAQTSSPTPVPTQAIKESPGNQTPATREAASQAIDKTKDELKKIQEEIEKKKREQRKESHPENTSGTKKDTIQNKQDQQKPTNSHQ